MRVLVLCGGAAPGERLAESLGHERAAAVRALLVERARAWAAAAFGADAVRLVEEGSFAAALSGGRVGSGPVVAIVPELPVWHLDLAAAVLGDLADGCALALAPIFDRGLYLLAIATRRRRAWRRWPGWTSPARAEWPS